MKLSIVVPVYKGVKKLSKFLSQLSVQTSKDYELILIIDTFAENALAEVDQYLSDYPSVKENFKLVFNSKRVGRSKAIESGVEVATGDYTILMSNTDVFGKTLVNDIKTIAAKHKSDIIEFNAQIKDPIKFDGEVRKVYKPSSSISNNPDIFAFTYAFDFNKIYKTEVIKKAVGFTFTAQLNSRFSIEFIFQSLLVAQTYSSINKNLVTYKSEISENYNPLKQIRQWKTLQSFFIKSLDNKYASEYVYNFVYTQTEITSKIVKEAKSKVLSAKYKADVLVELQSFNLPANPYLIQQSEEVQLIKDGLKKF